MLKDINAGAVLPDNQHRRRVQPDHLVAGPASGRILTKARLHRAQFDPVWWEKHQAQVEAEAAALQQRLRLGRSCCLVMANDLGLLPWNL